LKKLIVLTAALAVLFGGGTSTAGTKKQETFRYPDNNAWIKLWTKRDISIYRSMEVAAKVFHVSYNTLDAIQDGEGGNVHPAKLRHSLCQTWGIGWNTSGSPPSAAFGPMQFMLDYRGACNRPNDWGTFGAWDDAAFQDAKHRGVSVPYRFKTPASNVGQAVVTAYMLATPRTGGISHWCASIC
jgi:hypothetical protein